jgi:hypothetical protein
VLHLAGGGERRLQRGAGCHGGVQARQEEAKEDQERGEREDQRFVSHSACLFSLFWIRIRIDLALLNPDPHHNMVPDPDSEAINLAKMVMVNVHWS